MTVSVVPGYDFAADERPTSKSLELQAVNMRVTEIPFSDFPSAMVRAYINDLWPADAEGDGSSVQSSTTASGSDTEGSIIMDRGGHLWVRTRWGPTRFHAGLGGCETRRWPYLDINDTYPSHPGVGAMLMPIQNANDTCQTDYVWAWDGNSRNLGILMQTDVTNQTVGVYSWNPRVALYGFLGLTMTGYPTASAHRGGVLDSGYLGSTFLHTGDEMKDVNGHIILESVSGYHGDVDNSTLIALGGMYFGHLIPTAGLAL